ncbi:prepilin peptidase [Myxococcus xanthus]|uniref:Prepilin leader peptidase/N-methyltransferase n=1 Tax=Myxococcus xanthus TaxID=34 RepID=A0AAE6G497_MYXXA|nr:A24 family peptidase [Myxococcus xanthus]QDE70668.1 methyltransferase [Myxococcus xanthus]QDE77948.1 methyltransferase [Myxococcus xanthus]QDE85330.1 methyltransferase [Myxococcus xanthus]QDE99492.1 methyltransferase [Myxococcus xanthus]
MTHSSLPGYFGPLFAVFLFVLGLCVGSFLNVVIARVPLDQSIVRPRSRCPRCGHVLAWYENIPLLSWLALRARCRGCGAPISVRYPLVELLTGLLFFACLRRFGWTYELVPALVLVSLLVPLAFIDLDHWILPLSMTVSGMLAGIALALPLGMDAFRDSLIGAVVGFLSFRAMEYVGWKVFQREALGAGDKYLVAMLGAFLSWRALLGVLLFASMQGAVVGILMLLVTGRAGPRTENTPEEPVEDAPPLTMTWEFTQPGLPLWKRLLLVPVCLLVQPIPDAPLDEEGEEEEWVPERTSIPFGPWLALAGLELLLLGPWLSRVLPADIAMMLGGLP